MIVPRSRLIFWVGIIFLPFVTLAGLIPPTGPLCGSMIAGLVLLAIIDGILGRGNLKGLSAEFPEVVRLTMNHKGEFLIQIKNEPMRINRIRFGLPFPPEIQSSSKDTIVDLVADEPSSSFLMPCTGRKRGNYIIDTYFLEVISPLGFWALRSDIPTHLEFRVYPNLFLERKEMSAIFMNRGIGIHRQRQIGKGRDFEQLREYLPGDYYEDISWKATAKRMYPVSKIYQIERAQEVYVILDISRLSARNYNNTQEASSSIIEKYINAALIMALATQQQGDFFGLISFSDRIESFVKAKKGKSHFDACRDSIYRLHSQNVTPDFSELFIFIRTRIRRRSLLVFLTSLDDPVLAEQFIRYTDLISKSHLVIVNMLRPPATRPIFHDPSVESAEDLYRRLGGHIIWRKLRETGKLLESRGIGFTLLNHERMSLQLVTQYIDIKKKQIL